MNKLMNFVGKVKPTPQQAFAGLSMLVDAITKNEKITEEEITKRHSIAAMKEFEIAKMQANKEILKDYFEKVFSERRTNFDKLFNALDKGIENNNLDVIRSSLGAIVEIAKDSPLKNIIEDFHNPNVKEIEI